MYEIGGCCSRQAGMGALPVKPTTAALPWTGTFTKDKFSDEAALIDREWSRVMALPLYVPAEKIARYSTVATAARSLLNRVGDSRHPAFLAMTSLIQRIDSSLKAASVVKIVAPTVKPVVTNGKVVYPTSKCTAKMPATPYRADGGRWVCSADMSGPMANKWRWVWETAGRVVYDPFSDLTQGPVISQPPPITTKIDSKILLTDPKLKPADPQCFTAPCPRYVWSESARQWVLGTQSATLPAGPVVSPLPPGTTSFPVVTDSGVTMQPAGGGFDLASFDFGKFLKPPYLYILIGVGAWMFLKK